ncbi:hypothetical protein B0H66DRAFT_531273 [Apodospora peruviana]|uniref:Uncharacterized protein n=1 Tax=Apodospora peruviana TaxID=516989 RepID=A0AAE0IBE8_9PEZI|nr:hypothetical protein B0H66DRAFT_531273 [Apodospora peruviana]
MPRIYRWTNKYGEPDVPDAACSPPYSYGPSDSRWEDEDDYDELAPSVVIVRNRLRREYDEAFKRLEDKQFVEIKGGHSEEANSDPPRFVAKYFLDGRGRPDRNKTKEPLLFQLCNNEKEMFDVVAAVPGLAIRQTWSTGIDPELTGEPKYLHIDTRGVETGTKKDRPSAPVTLDRYQLESQNRGLHLKEFNDTGVIGGDSAAVKAEIAHLKEQRQQRQEKAEAEERASEARAEAQKKATWERHRKGYRELVAKQQRRPNHRSMQDLPGSYVVEWHGKPAEDYDVNDPYHDDDNSHIGHLDFDHTGLAAKGGFYYPTYFGDGVPIMISVVKVAEKPVSRKESMRRWCEYDGRRWGSTWGGW